MITRNSRLFKASDVMTEKVFFVNIDTPAEEVAQLIAAKGIVSRADIIRTSCAMSPATNDRE